MEPYLGATLTNTYGLHAICTTQACPIKTIVSILIHVSLRKSRQVTT